MFAKNYQIELGLTKLLQK